MAAWRAYTNKNNSIIVDLFHGQLGSTFTCLKCGKTSATYSSFSHLSLPLPTTKTRRPVPLLCCIEEFLQKEKLTDHWRCPICKAHKGAEKQLTIYQLPLILITQLKRLTSENGQPVRLSKKVEIPIKLDLTTYVHSPHGPTSERSQRFIYDLYAICDHQGDWRSGHYTASVRSLHRPGWNGFNDREVAPLAELETQNEILVRQIHDSCFM